MFVPRNRRERMLLKACCLLAEKAQMPMMAVQVAITQADEEEPDSPPRPSVEFRIKENHDEQLPAQ